MWKSGVEIRGHLTYFRQIGKPGIATDQDLIATNPVFIVSGACRIEPRVQQVAHPTGFGTAKTMRRVCKIFLHTRMIKYV